MLSLDLNLALYAVVLSLLLTIVNQYCETLICRFCVISKLIHVSTRVTALKGLIGKRTINWYLQIRYYKNVKETNNDVVNTNSTHATTRASPVAENSNDPHNNVRIYNNLSPYKMNNL